MRRVAALALCAFILLTLLSGCGFRLLRPIEELMRAPAPFDFDDEHLQETFRAYVGDAVLKSPLSGKYRSAFITYDINHDGTKEALVFFEKKTDRAALRMAVFRRVEDAWELVEDLSGSGSDVYAVDFADLSGDGREEILVTWNVLDSRTNRVLTVYRYDEAGERPKINSLCIEPVTVMDVTDIDNDGQTEIFLISQELLEERPQSVARVLKLNRETYTLSCVAETPLDADVSAYGKIKTEKAAADVPLRVYVDAYKGDTQMITELLYWDAKAQKLNTPLLDPLRLTNIKTLRGIGYPSMDINNDGVIEIPSLSEMPGGRTIREGEARDLPYYLTRWTSVRLDGSDAESFLCAMVLPDSYYFVIPEGLRELIAVTSDETQRLMRVRAYDADSGERGDELFTVVTVAPDALWSEPYNSYKVLFQTESAVTLANITKAGKEINLDEAFLTEYIKHYEGVGG